MAPTKLCRIVFCITIECVAMMICAPEIPQKENCSVGQVLDTLTATSKVPIPGGSHDLYMRYNDLKCGLIYSAHFHVYWTKSMYLELKPNLSERLPLKEISFVDESIKMINLLFYKNGVTLNEMWLLYMYAQHMDRFYKELFDNIKVKFHYTMSYYESLSLRTELIAALENYLRSNCDGNYYYFDTCERCENAVHAIRVNKKKINKLLDIYSENDESVKYLFNFKNISQLYFNSLGKPRLFDGFWRENLELDQWEILSSQLKTLKSYAIGFRGLKGIQYTGEYQRMVIDLLKFIMLKNIARYLISLRRTSDPDKSIYLFVGKCLDFQLTMSLFDDDHFSAILTESIRFMIDPNKQHLDFITNQIKHEIDAILKTWHYPGEYSLPIYDDGNVNDNDNANDNDNVKNNVNGNANDSETDKIEKSTRTFVRNVGHLFGTVYTFQYVHSFVKMVDDINSRRLLRGRRDKYIVQLKWL